MLKKETVLQNSRKFIPIPIILFLFIFISEFLPYNNQNIILFVPFAKVYFSDFLSQTFLL